MPFVVVHEPVGRHEPNRDRHGHRELCVVVLALEQDVAGADHQQDGGIEQGEDAAPPEDLLVDDHLLLLAHFLSG